MHKLFAADTISYRHDLNLFGFNKKNSCLYETTMMLQNYCYFCNLMHCVRGNVDETSLHVKRGSRRNRNSSSPTAVVESGNKLIQTHSSATDGGGGKNGRLTFERIIIKNTLLHTNNTFLVL